jgi:hypothetical protein
MNQQIDFSELLDLSDSVGTSLFTTPPQASLETPVGYHNFSLMLDETYTLSDSTVSLLQQV